MHLASLQPPSKVTIETNICRRGIIINMAIKNGKEIELFVWNGIIQCLEPTVAAICYLFCFYFYLTFLCVNL